GKHRLSGHRDSTVVIAGEAMLRHGVLDGFPLADEVKHHHRVRELRDERGKNAERDVPRDIGCAETDDDGRDEPAEAEYHGGEKRLRQGPPIMSPSPFVVEWVRRVATERSEGRALDLAIGLGRHATAIANAGFRTFGVDRNLDALRAAV